MNKTQPLLKWAGGKRKLAPLISKIVNDELPDTKNYVEPFLVGVLYILSFITITK